MSLHQLLNELYQLRQDEVEDTIQSMAWHQSSQRAIARLDYQTSQMEQELLDSNPAMTPYLHHLNNEIMKAEHNGYLKHFR